VVIAGTAATADGSLVHAVTVIQPVQTWTVIRAQRDFMNMHNSLASALQGIPPCPLSGNAGNNVNSLVAARHQLQQWLLSVLMFPGARESPAIRMFLTDAANIIPPEYENATWTMFDARGQVVNPAPTSPPAPTSATGPAPGSEFTMDMMMDDWGDDGPAGQLEEVDEEHEYRPSERYLPTNEPVSAQDEMEMANMAAEVEMIEDVGSLAQSLGASHIGRSLMLQDELGVRGIYHNGSKQHQHGVHVGSAVAGMGSGGIGSAMENATPGIGGGFNQTTPESAPRLDSFKMIKVIGKGSFGKSAVAKSGCT
jgi:PX domain